MLVVSHESIGVVAFSPWAALSCILSNTFAEIVIVGVPWLVRLPRNNHSLVDPVPNESLLCDLVNFM